MEGLFRCIYYLAPMEGLDNDWLIEKLESEETIEIGGLKIYGVF
jgi:hypothetical protein